MARFADVLLCAGTLPASLGLRFAPLRRIHYHVHGLSGIFRILETGREEFLPYSFDRLPFVDNNPGRDRLKRIRLTLGHLFMVDVDHHGPSPRFNSY